eukprot:685721-Pleurochrysis_carterae.AAC.5
MSIFNAPSWVNDYSMTQRSLTTQKPEPNQHVNPIESADRTIVSSKFVFLEAYANHIGMPVATEAARNVCASALANTTQGEEL